MRAIKLLAILLGTYLAIVVAFESLVVIMGTRQAARGVQPGESWVIITTSDESGSTDTVVAGVESGGQLYVAANHWLHRWYDRALENPDVQVTRAGERRAYLAVPVTGEERARIARDYSLPWAIRFLTGFPPRSFLRLNPR
jgi:hypothetical protein